MDAYPSAQSALRLGDPAPRRVLVFRALKLGDMLCAVPALRALRTALPEAHLTLLGMPWAECLVRRFPRYLDAFQAFPGYPGLPEQAPDIERWPRFLDEMHAERFDLAVQLHGSGSFVNPVTALLGARGCAGFFTPGDYCPDAERFLAYPDEGSEIRRLLALTRFLGCPDAGEHLEFPIRAADFAGLKKALGARPLYRRRYVCVHAGASVPERRWPARHFTEVARRCAERGLQVVLTGTQAEATLTAPMRAALGGAALDLAGQTDLGPLAALLAGARLVICNDTGVSHLAAALRVPSVVVSTGANPERWAPLDGRLHRVLCRPEGVAPDDVLRQAAQLLECDPRRGDSAAASSNLEAACAPCAS